MGGPRGGAHERRAPSPRGGYGGGALLLRAGAPCPAAELRLLERLLAGVQQQQQQQQPEQPEQEEQEEQEVQAGADPDSEEYPQQHHPGRVEPSAGPRLKPYAVRPMPSGYGAVAEGIDLAAAELSSDLRDALWADVMRWKVLLFRGQDLSGQRQVDITELFGKGLPWGSHRRTPHNLIYRVSNDPAEGFVGNGRSGYHIDGAFHRLPPKLCSLYCVSNCTGGETHFIPMQRLLESQPQERRRKWERLWMVHPKRQNAEGRLCTPLVYRHPYTGDPTMLFHCGDVYATGWSVDRDPERLLPGKTVSRELQGAAEEILDSAGLRLCWEAGDFALHDNLGNAHYASEGAVSRREDAGLRILHRIVIAGEELPTHADGATTHCMLAASRPRPDAYAD